jgi:anti-sigma regulatory factor (Ser/Thr protein kinase)
VIESPRLKRVWLAPEVTAPRRARDFVARACTAWDAEQFAQTGQLVVSELVSNAVLHSGTEIEVELRFERGLLRVSVHDDGPGLPAVVPQEERTIGGVGLDLVSQATESWGVTLNPRGGKDVWCVLSPDRP